MSGQTNLGTITTYIKVDTSGLIRGLAGAKVALGDFAVSMKKSAANPVNELAASMGRSMTLAGVGMAGGLGLATRAAGQFDQALRNVNSIAKLSEAQLGAVRKSLLALVDDPGVKAGPTELATGLYDVYSSGFQGKEALDILRVSALGASAGMTDTATASRALMAVLNSGVSGVNSAREAMDVLFQEVNLGVNSFEGLANAIGDVLPTASTAGVSLQEVGAALAVMTRNGINVNEAVTALNQMLLHVIKPSEEAAKLMDQLGVSYGIAGLQANGLTGWLSQVIEKTRGNTQALAQLMPEVRGWKSLMALATQDGRSYTEMLGGMRQATDGAGAATSANAEQMKGAGAQYAKLRAEVERLAIEIGENLLPVAKTLMRDVRDLTSAFSRLSPEARSSAVRIAAIGSVALVAAGQVVSLITRLAQLKVALAAAGVGGRLGALGALGPAGLVVAGGLGIKSAVDRLEGDLKRESGKAARDSMSGESGARFLRGEVARREADLRKREGLEGSAMFARMPAADQANYRARTAEWRATLAERRRQLEALEGPKAGTRKGGGPDHGMNPVASRPSAQGVGVGGGSGGGGGRGGDGGAGMRAQGIADRRRQMLDEVFGLTHGEYETRRREARRQYEEDVRGGQRRVDAQRLLSARLADIAKDEAAEKARAAEDAARDAERASERQAQTERDALAEGERRVQTEADRRIALLEASGKAEEAEVARVREGVRRAVTAGEYSHAEGVELEEAQVGAIRARYRQRREADEAYAQEAAVQRQADLATEMLEALGRAEEAEIARLAERIRRGIAGGDYTPEEGARLRDAETAGIRARYAAQREEERRREGEQERAHQDDIALYEVETNRRTLQSYLEYLRQRLAALQRYSDEWMSVARRIEETEQRIEDLRPRTMGELLRDEARSWEEIARQAAGSLHDAFAGLFANLLNGGRNWAKQFVADIKAALVRMAAELLASEVMKGLAGLFGGKKPAGQQVASMEVAAGVVNVSGVAGLPGPGSGLVQGPGIPGLPGVGGMNPMLAGIAGLAQAVQTKKYGGLVGSLAGWMIGGPLGGAVGGLIGSLLPFEDGGWVPGPPGAPKPALVHGGEFVLSRAMLANAAAGPAGPTANVTIHVHSQPGTDVQTLARRVAYETYRLMPARPGS